jgi:hypothetical protein
VRDPGKTRSRSRCPCRQQSGTSCHDHYGPAELHRALLDHAYTGHDGDVAPSTTEQRQAARGRRPCGVGVALRLSGELTVALAAAGRFEDDCRLQ